MGNRGSKSDKDLSVKEQRVDGSSVIYFESIKYYNCKVYSSRRWKSVLTIYFSRGDLHIFSY